MKYFSLIILLVTLAVFSYSSRSSENANVTDNTTAESVLGTKCKFVHVAIVVEEIEKSAQLYADLLGVSVPEIHEPAPYEQAHTQYKGKPTEAGPRLAFLRSRGLMIELIEPVGQPSVWNDFLKENGPGIQHLAFHVKDIDKKVKALEAKGLSVIQSGEFPGGQYKYVGGHKDLAMTLELLADR